MSERRRAIGLLFGAALGALVCVTSRSDAVEIIGHRGASRNAPRYTRLDPPRLEAERRRLRNRRASHQRRSDRRDSRLQHAAGRRTKSQGRRANVGRTQATRHRPVEGRAVCRRAIPTLAEYLAAIPAGKRLFIEIKCGPEIVPQLVEVIRKAQQTARANLS